MNSIDVDLSSKMEPEERKHTLRYVAVAVRKVRGERKTDASSGGGGKGGGHLSGQGFFEKNVVAKLFFLLFWSQYFSSDSKLLSQKVSLGHRTMLSSSGLILDRNFCLTQKLAVVNAAKAVAVKTSKQRRRASS